MNQVCLSPVFVSGKSKVSLALINRQYWITIFSIHIEELSWYSQVKIPEPWHHYNCLRVISRASTSLHKYHNKAWSYQGTLAIKVKTNDHRISIFICTAPTPIAHKSSLVSGFASLSVFTVVSLFLSPFRSWSLLAATPQTFTLCKCTLFCFKWLSVFHITIKAD